MRFNKKILIIISVLLFSNSYGQQQFQKKYESTNATRAYVVKTTNDNGYIIAGSYDVSGLLSAEYYIVKLDAFGDTVWSNTYGPAVDTAIAGNRDGAGNEAYDIIQTFDSGYIVVGEAHDSVSGQSNAYALKLTSTGDSSWTRTYGGLNSDYGYKIIQLADSGYILSGYTESFGLGIRNTYALRLDKKGDTLWTRAFGGSAIDGATDMSKTHDGGFIMVGNTFSFGAGNSDVYVVKFDINGNLVWARAYGGTMNDFGNSIALSKDKGFIISGSSESFGVGQRDVYVIKIDSVGELKWSKTFGGTGNESGKSVIELSNQDIMIMGNTRSFGKGFEDFYLLKLNSLGDTLMTRVYGGMSIDFGESIQQTSDKGFIMAGYTNSFNTFNFDVYIVKTDSLGNSSCHQGYTSTIVGNPATTKTNTSTVTSSGSSVGRFSFRIGKTVTNPVNVCNINSFEEFDNQIEYLIYPNPSNGFFSLNTYNTKEKIISVIDINGKLLETISSNSLTQKMNLSKYRKGIYFIQIKTEKTIISKKIIIY